jgi:alpha-beta hydrolase superfamily lysophospholipase
MGEWALQSMRLARALASWPKTMAGAALLVATAAASMTVPEAILFRERLALSLYEFESRIELQPLDIATHDGLQLRSWFYPPKPGKPVIVYFPGRVGDIIRKPWHLFDLAEEGYGLMLAGYRGYGGNPGRPSERLLYRDATTLLARLAHDELAPDGIVLYGYSMGTGIASYAASQMASRGLVLEAPFTSFRDVVSLRAGPVPMWLVRSSFDTQSRIASIDVPILLLAGQNDRVTPPAFAEVLAGIGERLSSLHIVPDASHDDLFEHGAWEVFHSFLDRVQEVAIPTAEAAEAAPVTEMPQ